MTFSKKLHSLPVFLAVLLLAALLYQCLWFSSNTHQTVDETYYNASAIPTLRFHDYRFIGEHPPLMMHLGGLMLELFVHPNFDKSKILLIGDENKEIDLSRTGSAFLYKMGNDPKQILFWERSAIILITVILGFVLFRWGYKLYGPGGTFISLILYCFSPNIITHGSLFTTDMGITAFYFIAAYCLYETLQKPTLKKLFFCGLFAGAALLAKISSLVWVPATFIIFFMSLLKSHDWSQYDDKKANKILFVLLLLLLAFSMGNKILGVSLTPLCLMAYAFTRPPRVLTDMKYYRWFQRVLMAVGWILVLVFSVKLFKKYDFMLAAAGCLWAAGCLFVTVIHFFRPYSENSLKVLKMFLLLWFIAAITVIFGYTDFPLKLIRFSPFDHYLRAFNLSSNHARSVHAICTGNFVTCDSGYFFKLMLVKSSLYLWGLFIFGIIGLFFAPLKRMDKFFLLIVPLTFFLAASFVNRINIGLRHILPVYPFVMLIAGASAQIFSKAQKRGIKIAGICLLAIPLGLYVFGTLKQAPHYLSYFSEWVGNEDQGVLYTSDSNIDWGQDNIRIIEFAKEKNIPLLNIASHTFNKDLFEYYGVKSQNFDPSESIPEPGFYILNIEGLREQKKNPQSWFAKNPWDYRLGRTMFAYEVKA